LDGLADDVGKEMRSNTPADTTTASPEPTNTPTLADEPTAGRPVDGLERIQIPITSSSEHYYVLYFRPDLQSDTEWPVSLTLGKEGTTILTEPLAAYPPEHF
jgi:hypothetical protein